MSHPRAINPVAALDALAPLRAAVAERCEPAEIASTYLVGGVVRDALIDRPLLDLDIATSADPESLARSLARAVDGTAFPLGDDFGCWRVAVTHDHSAEAPDPRLDTIHQIDVCALVGGMISSDLAHRDLTLNALAVPVAGAPTILDEHHGIDDLERGMVRMVAASGFDDDPLRMLRVARIAHVLDLDIDPATVAAVRARAARACEPAGERIFAELTLLLTHPESRRGWRLLEELGIDAVLLPELDSCRGIAQSRFHHLDVHDHTLAVLDNCEDVLGAHGFWLPLPDEPGLRDSVALDDEQRLAIILAALCHDLGKPGTRALRPDGRVSFVGHDVTGRAIVDDIADRWRWSNALRLRVRTLVGTHLALGFLLHGPRDLRSRWHWLRDIAPVAPEAVILSVGDRLATAGPDDRRRWVRAHLEIARAVWSDHWREVRDGLPTPLLDGAELIVLADIAPGPRVGELVRALAEAQAVGEVQSRVDAEDLVRQLVNGSTAPRP